jgi:pyridoxal phosphate enzyme (YggS family)
MPDIAQNLTLVRRRIERACAVAGRDPGSVRLVAVSKTCGADAIARAAAAGVTEFAESYLQEALAKLPLAAAPGRTFHFIGPLQSNKTREIAANFDWVQSVDRPNIATRLAEQRPVELPPLQVCVQVNISGEASKSGCAPGEAADLCRRVAGLPRLRLRGLMAIPAPGDPGPAFAALRGLFERLRVDHPSMDTLSAGMSDDLELAIAEGSTLVRVGTAIFGARER